jgi:spermidine/putrescine transport system permease protein
MMTRAMMARPLGTAAWWAYGGAVVLFMSLPLGLVVLFSFNSAALTSLPLTGLTFDWYRRLFANEAFWPALRNSLVVGLTVAGVSAAVGTAAALALSRMPPRRAGRLIGAFSLPMMLPALIIGVALLSFFVRFLGIRLSLATVILGHLVIAQPFVLLIVHARMARFDPAVVESARDLGASAWTAFRTVTLPIVQPTIVGAALIALSVSLDDFVITFFTIGGGNTLPTMVWGMVRTSLDPRINAIATLLILLSIGSTVVALRLSRYRG